MRTIRKLLARGLLLGAMVAFLGLSAGATRLMVVTDTHYMARQLYEGSDLFLRALQAGDGKLTQYSDELMEALLKEAAALSPDALIVTGDLSWNGERASHEALARWFSRFEALGIPVWVIPGNHDINVLTPRGFAGDAWYLTEGVDEAEFRAIYADYMLPPTEGANLSYLVRVDEGLCVAMTDAAYYRDMAQTFGVFTAGHAAWLEKAIEDAGDAEVITASHHNLLAHTEFMKESYVMLGGESMAALDRQHGVRLHLSGHLHVQHIAESEGVTDAALGAFCTWPHRYALVTLEDDGRLEYEARSLDARYLPDGFLDMSRTWYADIAKAKTAAALEGDEDAEAMADYAARFNLAYFSGTYRSDDPLWRQDPAYKLWSSRTDDLFWQYMKLVMDEPNGDNLHRTM